MSLINLLVVVIIIGLLFYLITLLPLPPPFKNVAQIIAIIICILWLASAFGVFPGGSPRLR